MGNDLPLDLDPLVPRARIGDGLDDAHVANAVLEIGMRTNAPFRFHAGDEVVFDVPAALQLRRHLHHVQVAVADAAGLQGLGPEVVGHRARFAVNFETIVGRERVDAAELEHAFGAVLEFAQDREQIRDDDVVTLPAAVQDFPARINAGDVAEPALEDFDVDAQGENIQAADLDALPPVRGRVGIQIGAGETLQAHMVRPAEVILREQFLDEQIAAQPERRRTKHRDQLGIAFRGGEHFLGLGEVHRHAGLAENVFARFQGGDGDGRMHVGRRADPDDIEIREREEVRPVLHGRGVRRVFLAELLRALVGGIRDGHDLDFVMLLQSGQVPPANNVPCPNKSEAQFLMIRPGHLSQLAI